MEISIFSFEEKTLALLLSKHSLSLLLLFLIFTLFMFKWLINHSSNNLLPSPPKLPIIGNLHQIGSIPQRSLKSLAEKFGPLMLLHFGNKRVLVVSSANAAEYILRTHDITFANRPKTIFARRLLYDCRDITFAPYGDYWRQIRSICVLQLLSHKRIQSFRSVREEEVGLMVEKIRESCVSGSPIRISDILGTLANNIISRVAVGKRYSGEKVGSKFKDLFEEYCSLLGAFNVGDYIPWLGWINHINGMESRVKRVARELDEYLENIVEEGIKRQEISKTENKDGKEGNKGQQTFIDVLLELKQQEDSAGHGLDRDSIKAIILDVFVGGTDTASVVLEWTMAELLKSPNAMAKLQDELRGFSRCESDRITEEDLEELPYLKAVIKESLRLHPPVPFLVPRESSKSVKIMNYDIPAGTQVLINAFAIGRDPSTWENAEEFRPERFLNSSIDTKGQHFQLIPFGSGRRSCPGSGFGLLNIELALANLMLKFNFVLAGGMKPEELDMIESPSIVTPRKTPLVLVASLAN